MYRHSKRFPELFRKSETGPWWAFLPRTGPGKAPRESTGHKDERAAHEWYLSRVRASSSDPRKDATTLRQALARRLEERTAAGRAAGTIDCLTKKAKQLERVLGHSRALESIDARAVDAYVATRLKEGMARTTIYKELVTLRGAMKLARRQGYAVKAVEEVMPLDFSASYKPKERALSEYEIGRLLEKLAPKRAAVVAFILATGATYPSEVAPLRKGDIDTKNWIVRLRGTKRHTRDRKVPIVSFARPWLEMAVKYLPLERWSNIRRDLHEACAAAGIAVCSPNDLRRSVATLLRIKGVEPHLIGVFLGHRDSRMAERTYARIGPSDLANLLTERLGDAGEEVSGGTLREAGRGRGGAA